MSRRSLEKVLHKAASVQRDFYWPSIPDCLQLPERPIYCPSLSLGTFGPLKMSAHLRRLHAAGQQPDHLVEPAAQLIRQS